jgi:Ser/Thr protein kinase RdoA (MazF antagonist)
MDKLIDFYLSRLHLNTSTALRIDHDDALVAVVYKIIRPASEPLILKISPRFGDYRRELYYLRHFAGKLPVPWMLDVMEPGHDIPGAILMQCMPGDVLKIPDLNVSLAGHAGALLAAIHLNRTAGYGDLTSPDVLSTEPRYYFTAKFEENFAECRGHLPEELLDRCRRYYDKTIELLASVDGPCIIHRDFRPGNMLAYTHHIQGIIDWASARASFAEEDFCSMEHGVWAIAPQSRAAFLAGYATVRPVPEYSQLLPLLRLNKALATVGFTVKHNTWQTKSALLYRFNRSFLETFFN